MKKYRKSIIGAVLVAIIAVAATGCGSEPTKKTSTQNSDQATTEAYYRRLQNAVPYPLAEMRDSIERRNIRERLLRFNKATKIGYVYLLGKDGNVVGYYTIKGKPSSTQSQMTASDLIVTNRCGDGSCRDHTVVKGPGDDGSYGENEKGIYFFTTEGVMIETDMNFIYSDAPMSVNASAVKLNLPANSKPTSVGDAKNYGGK